MKDLLINIIKSLGYPVFLQGSLGKDEEYPESFFTFWNNSSDDGSHYDNQPISYIWDFDLNFYSSDPTLVNTVLIDAKVLLKQAGFVVRGNGYDVASDEITHTGRGINVLIFENNKED